MPVSRMSSVIATRFLRKATQPAPRNAHRTVRSPVLNRFPAKFLSFEHGARNRLSTGCRPTQGKVSNGGDPVRTGQTRGLRPEDTCETAESGAAFTRVTMER